MTFLDIGKAFITYILKKCESISSLYNPYNKPGWYQYLFNSLFGNSSVDDIKNLNLSIINYNYDRSLECYLHQSIKYRFNLKDDSALEILHQIPIIHIHGILGQYPDVPYEVDDDICKLIEISRNIKIIHELIEESDSKSSGYFCSSEYKKSYLLLEHSEKICFLGFGFHEVNMRRFNFFKAENIREKEIFGTFADLGSSQVKMLLSKLSKYGLSNIKHSGHICNAFFNFETSLD